jgi:hypothetical protein
MLEEFVPGFDSFITEGYNAKLPDDVNAFSRIDSYLTEREFKRREMPAGSPKYRRFLYWKGKSRVVVTVFYAGKDIDVELQGARTHAKLTQAVIPDFIKNHLGPYVGENPQDSDDK